MSDFKYTPLSADEKEKSTKIHQDLAMGFVAKEDMEYLVRKEILDPKLLCIFWGLRQRLPLWLLNEDKKGFQSQLKTWRKEVVEGRMMFHKENCRTHEYKGRKFYGMVVQPYSDGEMVDMGGDGLALMFGWFVNGLTYFFTSEKNRDASVEYLMKGIDPERFD